MRLGAMAGQEACDGGLCVYLLAPYVLYQYHTLIMDEMERRGYNVTPQWKRLRIVGKFARRIPKWMHVRGRVRYTKSTMMRITKNVLKI